MLYSLFYISLYNYVCLCMIAPVIQKLKKGWLCYTVSHDQELFFVNYTKHHFWSITPLIWPFKLNSNIKRSIVAMFLCLSLSLTSKSNSSHLLNIKIKCDIIFRRLNEWRLAILFFFYFFFIFGWNFLRTVKIDLCTILDTPIN